MILLSKPFYKSNHFEQYYVIFNKPLYFNRHTNHIVIKLNGNIIIDDKIEKIDIHKHTTNEYPVDSYYITLTNNTSVDFLVDPTSMEIIYIKIIKKFKNFYTELMSPYITPYSLHSEWNKTIDIVEINQFSINSKI